MTLLSWNLDMDSLRRAERCAAFEAFDPGLSGVPLTTTELAGLIPTRWPIQTMTALQRRKNVLRSLVATPHWESHSHPEPRIGCASLPQTFLDIFGKQAAKMRAS